MNYDLQLNDIGIAKCHFEFAALELKRNGVWETVSSAPTALNWEYVTSWKCLSF